MWVGLSGPFPRQLLADVARYRVQEKLQTVPGVGEITLGGYLERNVRIWLDADKLDERGRHRRRRHRARCSASTSSCPAGRLETEGREVNVRVLGEALDLEALRQHRGAASAGGAPVYLEDVALVEDGFEDVRRVARVNGEPAQGLGIRKQRGANAVAVARRRARGDRRDPEDAARGHEARRPLRLDPLHRGVGPRDPARAAARGPAHRARVLAVPRARSRARSTWSSRSRCRCSARSPSSTSSASRSTPSRCSALSLAVGIVVDDAIMVLENIFRHAEMGKDRVRAAREGTREITFAALAATLAVVAIFLPVVFMKGVIGKFFFQFGVTLSVAVLLSLPRGDHPRAGALRAVPRRRRARTAAGSGAAVDRALRRARARLRAGCSRAALRRPALVLVGGAGRVRRRRSACFRALPGEFVPSQDQSRLHGAPADRGGHRASTRPTGSSSSAEAIVADAARGRRASSRVVGGGGGGGRERGHACSSPWCRRSERKLTQARVRGRAAQGAQRHPGPARRSCRTSRSRASPPSAASRSSSRCAAPTGTSSSTQSASVMRRSCEASGLVADVDSDYQLGMPELRIVPDRARAADLGVSVEDVATTHQRARRRRARRQVLSTGGRRIDVRVRLLADQRTRPEDLGAPAACAPPAASWCRSRRWSRHEERPALQAITRRDRERAITIFANVAPGQSQAEALARGRAARRRSCRPATALVLGGAERRVPGVDGRACSSRSSSASSSRTWCSPRSSTRSCTRSRCSRSCRCRWPARWSRCSLAGKTLNIFSMIGLLLLMGIVKKNSIILVDYANQLRDDGPRTRARRCCRPGPVRLRPILMTSIATMMAAVPPALGARAGRRDARADGGRGDRRPDRLDRAQPARGAGVLSHARSGASPAPSVPRAAAGSGRRAGPGRLDRRNSAGYERARAVGWRAVGKSVGRHEDERAPKRIKPTQPRTPHLDAH